MILLTRKRLSIMDIRRLVIIVCWFIYVFFNFFGNCLAWNDSDGPRSSKGIPSVPNNLTSSSSSTGIREVSLNNERKDQSPDAEQIVSIPRRSNGLQRAIDTSKLRKVCKLLQNALGSLQELSPSTQEGGTLKEDDKSPKAKAEPKPKLKSPMRFFPCGCGGCCLMRPMIMCKVKYTPPKFKMKPLKSKTKCGNPHYGICLGRRKR